ncbi:hypothetical protein BTVI_88661 [Pitangus sulphuratus]|nr:hypothetical protein BTVI_88661 [Pitangus sulphuratus]
MPMKIKAVGGAKEDKTKLSNRNPEHYQFKNRMLQYRSSRGGVKPQTVHPNARILKMSKKRSLWSHKLQLNFLNSGSAEESGTNITDLSK